MLIESKRNYGVDLMRIVSMWMVAVLHVLGQGGILKNCMPGNLQYWIAWFLEIGAYGAVNCFALISGYVSVGTKFRLKRVILLWMQVFFISTVITAISVLLRNERVGGGMLFDAFCPVGRGRWWYITAYFGIIFFTPFITKLLDQLNRKQTWLLIFIIFIIFTIVPIFMQTDPFKTGSGYSTIWLMELFVVGACLKKFPPSEWIHKNGLWLWLACIVFTWISKFALSRVNVGLFKEDTFVSYDSPTIFLSAIFLVLWFSRLRIGTRFAKIISLVSPLALGVYLIHVHPVVWSSVINGLFIKLASLHPLLIVPAVLLSAAGIFVVCALLDWLRALLFRVLKLSKLAEKLETKLIRMKDRLLAQL